VAPENTQQDIVRWLVVLGRRIRACGGQVDTVRLANALAALGVVDPRDPEQAYWALRCALTSRPEHVPIFDAVLGDLWPASAGPAIPTRTEGRDTDETELKSTTVASAESEPESDTTDETAEVGGCASAEELLRELDLGSYDHDDLLSARRLIERIEWSLPRRRTRRMKPTSVPKQLDVRRTTQRAMRTGGTPMIRHWRARSLTHQRTVLLLDVSGSMAMYSRPMLMFAQSAVRASRRVEVFTFGTRLTRVTDELDQADPERALATAGCHVRDWSGGTRISDSLRDFNHNWARRGISRGAVVVIVSDGWERGDVSLLDAEMAKLGRSAHTIVWVNPLAGDPDYEPLAAGMAAALRHVDVFLPGHNLNALGDLVRVLQLLPRSRPRAHIRAAASYTGDSRGRLRADVEGRSSGQAK
jgi:uncharacterized protein